VTIKLIKCRAKEYFLKIITSISGDIIYSTESSNIQ
jgi:hypothetical protein